MIAKYDKILKNVIYFEIKYQIGNDTENKTRRKKKVFFHGKYSIYLKRNFLRNLLYQNLKQIIRLHDLYAKC